MKNEKTNKSTYEQAIELMNCHKAKETKYSDKNMENIVNHWHKVISRGILESAKEGGRACGLTRYDVKSSFFYFFYPKFDLNVIKILTEKLEQEGFKTKVGFSLNGSFDNIYVFWG